jgi:FkbM family methyltransferase
MAFNFTAPSQPMSPSAPYPLDTQRVEAIIDGLYRGLLLRAPEPPALLHWTNVVLATGDTTAVAHAIVNSEEYKKLHLDLSARASAAASLVQGAAHLFSEHALMLVDVGAQDLEAEGHVYGPLIGAGLPHRVIGFEPLAGKNAHSSLRTSDGSVVLHDSFVGDGGEHVFHINSYDATSSLLPFNERVISDLVGLSDLYTERTEVVQTDTLDQALHSQGTIDFLKLDIQGFELKALQHAPETLARANVIHCEVSFAEIYKGQALFSEVEQHLRRAGFEFVDLSTSCRYPFHCKSRTLSADRLGWGDAVFFRQQDALQSPRDLMAQALVALLVYKKYSLAEFLLERFDKAQGTRFADLLAVS